MQVPMIERARERSGRAPRHRRSSSRSSRRSRDSGRSGRRGGHDPRRAYGHEARHTCTTGAAGVGPPRGLGGLERCEALRMWCLREVR